MPKIGDSVPASVVLSHEIADLAEKFQVRKTRSHTGMTDSEFRKFQRRNKKRNHPRNRQD